MKPLNVYLMGVVPYSTALDIQNIFLRERISNNIDDSLILLEHPHTFTIGRRGSSENLLVNEHFLEQNNIELVKISRGGDITYHGPGQLVGYPIFDLNIHGRDIHKFLRNLEEVIIRCIDRYGIPGRRIDKLTGVWVKRSKIASIGVGIKRWTTYHGFALNVNTDLGLFDMINPCGMKQVKMTSIRDWTRTGEDIDLGKVKNDILRCFSEVFEVTVKDTVDLESLGEEDLLDHLHNVSDTRRAHDR